MKNKFYIGDEVICTVSSYSYLRYNGRYKVSGIANTGALHLYGINGTYKADNFELYYPKEQDQMKNETSANSLYIAVRTRNNNNDEKPLETIAGDINCGENYHIYAFANGEACKDWIRGRLTSFPNEKWMILYGNTIGQVTKEVRFTSI